MKLGVMIGPTNRKIFLTFGDDPVPDKDSGSLFHFIYHCIIRDFRRFIGIYHTVTYRPVLTILSKMADADNVMNPHFASNLADIRIRIRINPEIWIRIPICFG